MSLEDDLVLAHRLADAARAESMARFRAELGEEAGGRFSNPYGSFTLSTGGVFADGLVHDQTLSLLARAGEGIPR